MLVQLMPVFWLIPHPLNKLNRQIFIFIDSAPLSFFYVRFALVRSSYVDLTTHN